MPIGKKYGGRQKGTPNKKTQEFAAKYDELVGRYADPVEALFAMVADKECERSVKRAAASELISYRYPKRKAIEHSGEIKHNDAASLSDAELANIAAGSSEGVAGETEGKTVTH